MSKSALAGEPEAGLGEVALGEGQHLPGRDREDERVAALVAEQAVPHLEVPIAVILRPPRFRQMDQQLLVSDAHGGAFDDDIEPGLPRVVAGREHAVRVSREVHALLFLGAGAEVERTVDPDGRQWRDMRPPVGPNCRNPEQLGAIDGLLDALPWRCRCVRVAEAGVELTGRYCRSHRSPPASPVWNAGSHSLDQSSTEQLRMLGSEVVRHPFAFLMPTIQGGDIRPAMTVAGRSLQADEAGT